jgi:hypothetical protein
LVLQGDLLLDRETMMPYSGPVFELYSDEQVVRSRSTLKNGVPDGLVEFYNKSGQTILRIAFKGDSTYLPDGPYEVYYDLNEYETVPINTNGLQQKATIEDGEYHGASEHYSRQGTLFSKGTYNMGEKCGEWLESLGSRRTDRTVNLRPLSSPRPRRRQLAPPPWYPATPSYQAEFCSS